MFAVVTRKVHTTVTPCYIKVLWTRGLFRIISNLVLIIGR